MEHQPRSPHGTTTIGALRRIDPKTWLHNACVCFASVPQSVEERCKYGINPENGSWTDIKREAWISSNVYGLTRGIQVSRVKLKTLISLERVDHLFFLLQRQGLMICHPLTGNIIRRENTAAGSSSGCLQRLPRLQLSNDCWHTGCLVLTS